MDDAVDCQHWIEETFADLECPWWFADARHDADPFAAELMNHAEVAAWEDR